MRCPLPLLVMLHGCGGAPPPSTAAKPTPAEAEPTPVAAEPKPVTAEPTPVTAEPTPVTTETKAVAAETKPVTAEPKLTYLILYRPGPAWAPGKPITEQPPKEHGKYLLDLFAKGTMKLAGPLMDDTGGAVVIEVASEAEAKAIANGDPAVQKGVFVFELHPWKLVPWEKYLKKPPAPPAGRDGQ
jgi:uncharacterized protein YciI